MKKIFKENENRICLALFIITILVAVSPLISRYCINGHDLEYHLLRIESLKEGILNGRPFLKVNMLFFGGAGYASSLFYSDLFMYIPAILRVLGLSIGASYHIFLIVMFVLCYLSTYYCVYKMTSSKYVATLAAVLLTLCPYHMDDMLIRAACGEIMAFVFVPFVIYGIYNVIFEEMDRPYIFGIGFAGLILSHPATLFFNVAFALLAFLIFIKRIIANKKVIGRLILTTVITVFATAFQWVPMLEQMMSARFYVSSDSIDMLDAAVDFSEVFTQGFPAVGVLLLILIIPRVFLNKENHEVLKYADVMILAGFLFAVGSTNVMPWERLERFLRFVQFPWRLFLMTSVLFAISAAIILPLFVEKILGLKTELALFLVTAAAISLALSHQSDNAVGYYDYADDYYSYKPYTANVIGGEWLPDTVTEREALVTLSEYMIDSNGENLDFERSKGSIIANVKAADYVDVPFIYYKGYKAILTEENGNKNEVEITSEGTDGLCRVYTKGLSGSLFVTYKGTTAQHLSLVLSLVVIIALIALEIIKRKKKNVISSSAAVTAIIAVCIPMMLMGCSSNEIETTARQIQELNEILHKEDEAEEENVQEIEEVNYKSFNYSQEGYDSKGKQFALCTDTESGSPEYSYVSLDEADDDSKPEIIQDMYGKLADEYIAKQIVYYDNVNTVEGEIPLDKEALKIAIMQQADILLYLNYYPEGGKVESLEKLAKRLAFLIYESSDFEDEDIALNYNCAAVLSGSIASLDDFDGYSSAEEMARRLWNDAESMNSDDNKTDVNRAWAAAELFRVTGNKTYRTIVESLAEDSVLAGFSYDNPGYYCVFAYLSANSSTDYGISSQMMGHLFDDINSRIRLSSEDLLKESTGKENLTEEGYSKEYINSLTDDCTLSMMANYISMSVEYTRFSQERILVLSGVNPVGFDYFKDENINLYNPVIFALCSLAGN